jgi:transposase-like protein
MKKETTPTSKPSTIVFEELDSWVRESIREKLQHVLEEELTEFIGRAKSDRRRPLDPPVYRNGHGKERSFTLGCGTVTVRRPRVRGLEERFESRVLPLFVRRTREVSELLPELYLHGLALGDFEMALRGLLGDAAPLSAATVGRLKEKWHGEFEEWSCRRLDDLEVVYLWADGVSVKAGFEKEKSAVLVAIAALSDGRKVVVAIRSGYRESKESWADLLRDLKRRGLGVPKLVIADGHLGIWSALGEVFPQTKEQRCWNHKIVNVLDRVPKKLQAQALLFLKPIPYAETSKEAERLRKAFEKWCHDKGLAEAAKSLERDWERLVTFFGFPKEHWTHLRTTNAIESPFAALRLRTDAAKRYRKVENATAVIWKMLMVAQSRFRRLHEPDLAMQVYAGVKFVDGVRVKEEGSAAAA